MKQVAQNYRSGEMGVVDAPIPACLPGGVLVRTVYSLISTGTEVMKVNEARLSLIGKAKARPDQVRKLMDAVAQQGPAAAYRKAMAKLDAWTPLGYSVCGVVEQVGAGADEFSVGDLVACAGNEFALHAEVNWVPTNLTVRVPDGVAPEHAAFATVGAIAMQGVRRAETQLGETAVVIGLGLVGQLVVRLLIAGGVRVIGVDTVEARCRLAEKAGALLAAGPDETRLLQQALDDHGCAAGADQVFLAAGGTSNGPVELAVHLARDRARIVDIGKTKLDLPWNDYYEKELDLRFSRSYGPGRYDDRYELDGVDYPIGYVRWTERRNMACFLDLIAAERVEVAALIDHVFPLASAVEAYDQLRSGSVSGVGFLFEYPVTEPQPVHLTPEIHHDSTPRRPSAPAHPHPRPGPVRIGFIGAGAYATSMLLPHLAADPEARLQVVATTKSLSALNAQRTFGFDQTTTSVDQVLDDPRVDAVFVVTRHQSHAEFTCRALEAGKAVFVEKPLALTEAEVARITETVASTGNDRLMVGFNRRFSAMVAMLNQRLPDGDAPFSARYLVNAGQLDAGSWYADEANHGTRWVGEGGHFVDTVSHILGGDPIAVRADTTGPDTHVRLRYRNGSIAQIGYLTTGHPRFPKETIDITGGGANLRLDNFTQLTAWTPGGRRRKRALNPDKGHKAQLAAFVASLRRGEPMPIAFHSLVSTTRATLAVNTSLATGSEVMLP